MPSPSPTAGGAPIAAGAIFGTIGGVLAHEPTIGFLAGTGIGVVIALLIWWKEHRNI